MGGMIMPVYVSWEPGLSIFVEEIDNQQQELYRRLNEFFSSVVGGDGKDEADKIMEFLVDYCVVHFGIEELYMETSGYPRFSEHRRAHEQFTSDVLDIQREIQDGTNSFHVISLVDLLGSWVAEHIGKMDKDFGVYVRSVQSELETQPFLGEFQSDRQKSGGRPAERNGRTCKYVSDCAVMFDRFQDPESKVFWRNRYCLVRQCEDCERKKMIEAGYPPAQVPLTLLPNGDHLPSLAD
jgi:hemerythrin